jgi:polyhydroxybutyrate depolymerase
VKEIDVTKFIFTIALWMASLAPAVFAESKIMTWKVDGVTREAIVYLPTAKTAGGKAPLVLAFHGHGDDARNFQGVGIHEHWPQAIVVYPEGLPSPRDGAAGWQVEKGEDGDRDLKLVDQILAGLRESSRVDDTRIYSTGFSNGANFTYLLWAERPQIFAAFAPVAARIRPSVHFTTPKPLFHTGGTADRQIPFADQQAAIESARRANGATGKGESCGTQCTVYTSDLSGGKAGAPVMTLIHSGGHVYPEQVSQLIVDFFRKYTRAGASRQQHD